MGYIRSWRREVRASAGDGASLSNPPGWLMRMMGAMPTTAGVDINERTALQLSTVYGCVRAIAEDVAKMPIVVGRELSPRGRKPLPNHRSSRLLRRRPNPEIDAFNFRRTILAHALLWGNGVARIERNAAGIPIGLWNQRPDRWWLNRLSSGQLEYTFTNDMGR
jgi:HK97 family phage portal protein